MIKKVVLYAQDKSIPPLTSFCIVDNRSARLYTGPMDTTGQFILVRNVLIGQLYLAWDTPLLVPECAGSFITPCHRPA